jgi:hypothetical protein
MPKKPRTELLPPVRPAIIPDMRGMLERLVEEKVAQVMAKKSDALFQPYFQGRKVAAEIRRNQTVSERKRWGRYFKKWGCDVCGTKERQHYALGRCLACYRRTEQRLNEIMAHGASQKGSIAVFLDRQGDLARAALKARPLPPEKRMDLEGIARESLRPIQKALPAKRKK